MTRHTIVLHWSCYWYYVALVLVGTIHLPAEVEVNKKVRTNCHNVICSYTWPFSLKVCVKQTILPYHQLMTPQWIQNYSTIVWTTCPPPSVFWNFFFYRSWLTTSSTSSTGILATTDSVTVTITVAMDTVLADSTDHDPWFGISDDSYFVGIQHTDKAIM